MTELQIIRASIAATLGRMIAYQAITRQKGIFGPVEQGRLRTTQRHLEEAADVLEGLSEEEFGKEPIPNQIN